MIWYIWYATFGEVMSDKWGCGWGWKEESERGWVGGLEVEVDGLIRSSDEFELRLLRSVVWWLEMMVVLDDLRLEIKIEPNSRSSSSITSLRTEDLSDWMKLVSILTPPLLWSA